MHEDYRDEKVKELRDQLTRFAPKTKKKTFKIAILNFEFLINGELSKIGHFLVIKEFKN